jgi:hypothetical protein
VGYPFHAYSPSAYLTVFAYLYVQPVTRLNPCTSRYTFRSISPSFSKQTRAKGRANTVVYSILKAIELALRFGVRQMLAASHMLWAILLSYDCPYFLCHCPLGRLIQRFRVMYDDAVPQNAMPILLTDSPDTLEVMQGGSVHYVAPCTCIRGRRQRCYQTPWRYTHAVLRTLSRVFRTLEARFRTWSNMVDTH